MAEKVTGAQEEPTRTATCVHLQAIERTMRVAGIRVKRWTESYVDANCRIQPEELKRSFPEAPVSYREYFESERAGTQDFPMARIFCDQCRSAICVIHPLEAKQETPWFPRL